MILRPSEQLRRKQMAEQDRRGERLYAEQAALAQQDGARGAWPPGLWREDGQRTFDQPALRDERSAGERCLLPRCGKDGTGG